MSQTKVVNNSQHLSSMNEIKNPFITGSSNGNKNSEASNNKIDVKKYEEARALMRQSINNINTNEMNNTSEKALLPKYSPISFRGAGAFGYVIEAYDVKNDCRVAIKRTHKIGKKLSREYKILAELKECIYTVEMLDTFYTINDDGAIVQNIVFEYVSNSLENEIDRLKNTKEFLSFSEIRSIFMQILEGLVFCKKKNIVHRDLKPENILYTNDKRVKICDFGSSKIIYPIGFREKRNNGETTENDSNANNTNINDTHFNCSNMYLEKNVFTGKDKENGHTINLNSIQGNGLLMGKLNNTNNASDANNRSNNKMSNSKYYNVGVETRSTPYIVSRYYRAPELILGCDSYDSSIDIFATGCIFFELISLSPLFPGRAEGMQLFEQMVVLGKMPKDYLPKFPSGKVILDLVNSIEKIDTVNLDDLLKINKNLNKEMIHDLNDMIMKMICWWPHERLSASQALKHEFFTKEYK